MADPITTVIFALRNPQILSLYAHYVSDNIALKSLYWSLCMITNRWMIVL